MRFAPAWLLLLVGCYHPDVAGDVPCAANGDCPPQQQCDFAQAPPRCVFELIDAHPFNIPDAPEQDAPEALGPWGPPKPIIYAPTGSDDDPTLTGDRLELVFNRANDLYVMTRVSLTAPWSAPARIDELSTASLESTPEISLDGLTLYFSSNRAGSSGVDIWVSTRASRNDPWGTAVLVPSLESPSTDRCATPGGDPDVLVMASNRMGAQKFDLYSSVRNSAGIWDTPVPLVTLNSTGDDTAGILSGDDLTIYFFSTRSGNADLYQAHRATKADAFGTPTVISELATMTDETDPWVSPDEHYMAFARGSQLFETTR
jgi:hypothetical protein